MANYSITHTVSNLSGKAELAVYDENKHTITLPDFFQNHDQFHYEILLHGMLNTGNIIEMKVLAESEVILLKTSDLRQAGVEIDSIDDWIDVSDWVGFFDKNTLSFEYELAD